MLNIVDRKMDEDVHCVVLHSKSFFSWLTSQRAGIGQHPPNALQNALRFSTILAGPPVRITQVEDSDQNRTEFLANLYGVVGR